jgi:hypothetical protein
MTDGSVETFRLDQPQANDLVGAPLLLAGSGGGFEATIDLRVLDGNGQVLLETSVTSTNLISPWQASIEVPDPPPTTRGVVEAGPSTGATRAWRGCPCRCSSAPPSSQGSVAAIPTASIRAPCSGCLRTSDGPGSAAAAIHLRSSRPSDQFI